jgi:dolichyl-phosphate-mannose-protein mannosyltransferase
MRAKGTRLPVSVGPAFRPRIASRWQSFEAWVGTRSSAAALFALALAVFALQSIVLPVYPGRDMGRYVQTFVQFWYDDAVLPSVLNTRGPLAALGVGLPLELGGVAAEFWLGLLYAASIVAWGVVALRFGARAAILTTGLLLLYPGYGILFHGLASDALFAAAFAGWAVVLSQAMVRPSIKTFLIAGAGMGLLVLVRPPNQVLIVFALLPLLLRAPWRRRLEWVAAFFVASAVVTQSWKALVTLHYGDAVALRPSGAVLAAALLLLPLLLPATWRRRLVLLAIPLIVGAVGVLAVKGSSLQNPVQYARSVVQSPPGSVFLYRAFIMDRIISPDNGPASRELAQAIQRELLTQEPYRSYGVDVHEFFSSGSERVFADLTSLGGSADLPAVTHEAIRRHPRAFSTGIARTIWEQMWARRIYAPEAAAGGDTESSNEEQAEFIIVNGRRLPRPSEGQPIPASRGGPAIWTLGGGVREVWQSPTEHPLVFDDPRDERRYARFERDTNRLVDRIPTRDASQELVHRLNQASRAFPPLVVWLCVGLLGLAVRRPRRALVALAPAVAGLSVIVATSLVAPSVPEYAAPVGPAFILLAAVGLVGAHPRGGLRLPRRPSERAGSL